MTDSSGKGRRPNDFTPSFEKSAEQGRKNFVSELVDFARHNKTWWLTPIIVVLLLIALFVVVTGTGVGALLYPLF